MMFMMSFKLWFLLIMFKFFPLEEKKISMVWCVPDSFLHWEFFIHKRFYKKYIQRIKMIFCIFISIWSLCYGLGSFYLGWGCSGSIVFSFSSLFGSFFSLTEGKTFFFWFNWNFIKSRVSQHFFISVWFAQFLH